MENKELEKLQRYIGKKALGQTDEEVIRHIEKINTKAPLTREEWEKLLYPSCANADIVTLKYILGHLKSIENVKDFILHTVGFRNNDLEHSQVEILRTLISAMSEKDECLTDILDEALIEAAWFGEYEVVKYLVEKGADANYKDEQNRSILELSQNAIDRFSDYRVYKYILSLT